MPRRSPTVPLGPFGGHVWNVDPRIQPRLLSVAHRRYQCPVGQIRRIPLRQWVVGICYTSNLQYQIGGRDNPWQPWRPEAVHLYAPGLNYAERTSQTTELQSAYLLLEGAELLGLPSLVGTARYARFRDLGKRLSSLILELVRLGLHHGDAALPLAQAQLWQIAEVLTSAALEADGARQVVASPAGLPSFAQQTQMLLRQQLDRPLVQGELARALQVSASTLSHRYKQECGETPAQTLAHMRIAAAKALLLRGEPLKVVAQEVGFCDAFAFSRAFKRLQGISPRQFRQQRWGAPGS